MATRQATYDEYTLGEKFMDYYIVRPLEVTPQFIEICKENGVKVIIKTTSSLTGNLSLLKQADIEVVDLILDAKFPSAYQIERWIEVLDRSYAIATNPDRKNVFKFTFMIQTTDSVNKGPLLVVMAMLYRGYNMPEVLSKVRQKKPEAISDDYFDFLMRWEVPNQQSSSSKHRNDCISLRRREGMCSSCAIF